jgi:hypothetical protein
MRQGTLTDSNDLPRGDLAEAITRAEAIAPVRGIMPSTFERLRALIKLEPDWDSRGGRPLSLLSIGKAVDLLLDLTQQRSASTADGLRPFGISPLGDGGIQLEWRGPLGDVEVEIHSDGEYSYLLIERDGNERRFEEVEKASAPEILVLLSRILVPS